MQCLGAIYGASVVKGFQPNQYQLLGGGANVVNHSYTKWVGLGAEIVGIFVLFYIVFSATDVKRNARDSHVPDKFNVKNFEDAEHVVRGVNLKCQSLYRNWRHKIKKHYLQLVNNGQDPYGKSYRGVSNEDWAWMIDNIWTNPDKEARAEQNRHARLCSLYDHTMGSLSFPAAMSIQAIGDQLPHIADFYKTSHFNIKKNKWVDPICEQLHTQLEARRQEVEAPGSTLLMTQEEIAVEVLGKKSGYLRGYGVGPKPSSSKRFSVSSHEKVQILQNKVQTLTDLCKRQEEKISEYDTQIQRQEEKICEYDTKFECQAKKIEQLETFMCNYMQGGRV